MPPALEVEAAAHRARQALEAFRHWAEHTYPAAAAAIASGLELERAAIDAEAALRRLEGRRGGAWRAVLPSLPLAHTSPAYPGAMPAAYAALVRLPNHAPGQPVHWPKGERHPWQRCPFELAIAQAAYFGTELRHDG